MTASEMCRFSGRPLDADIGLGILSNLVHELDYLVSDNSPIVLFFSDLCASMHSHSQSLVENHLFHDTLPHNIYDYSGLNGGNYQKKRTR